MQGFGFAEGEGFEPPVPRSTTVFKTAAFDHSANPLFSIKTAAPDSYRDDHSANPLWGLKNEAQIYSLFDFPQDCY